MRQSDRRNTHHHYTPNSLPLPLPFGKRYTVLGGPYMHKPEGMRGVKMAAEIAQPCDINIPTRDYSIPKTSDLLEGLERALQLIAGRKPLYVGCMGGKGRTGVFMAALVRLWGVEGDPVAYVRKHYNSHAVETTEQEQFINRLKFPPALLTQVKLAKAMGVFSFRENVTRI